MGRHRNRESGGGDSRRRDRKSHRDRGARKERSSGRGRTHHSRRRRDEYRSSRSRRTAEAPLVPSSFNCHICVRNHWTVDCPKLRRHPEDFPLLDRRKGCWRCGQRGHSAAQCKNVKYRCKECGGMHDTKGCIYDHVGEEWCEFVDPATKHVFYANADESQVQWLPPTHELDSVVWYCPACRVLNPSKTDECLKCHAARPSSVLAEEEQKEGAAMSSSDSSSSDSSSSGSSTDSDSDSESGSSDDEDDQGNGVEDGNRDGAAASKGP